MWTIIPDDKQQITQFVHAILRAADSLEDSNIDEVLLPGLLHVLAYLMGRMPCPDRRRAFAESLQNNVLPEMLRDAEEFAVWHRRRRSN
jgi:hypothetical protein